jgi:hypothetical protein
LVLLPVATGQAVRSTATAGWPAAEASTRAAARPCAERPLAAKSTRAVAGPARSVSGVAFIAALRHILKALAAVLAAETTRLAVSWRSAEALSRRPAAEIAALGLVTEATA